MYLAKVFVFCLHCGADRPCKSGKSLSDRSHADWVVEDAMVFCSPYCQYNFSVFLDRQARKGKKI